MENPFKKNAEKKEEVTEENTAAEENTEAEAEAETDTSTEEVSNQETNPWQEKYEALNNQYIRLAADFDNFRKRQESERESLLKYGAENTVKKLIEVIDNFDRGAKALESIDDCEKAKECFNMAYKNFNDALNKIGLETIKAEGEIFDPNIHEAVMQTPTADKPEHTIIAELQKGYKLGDKVLRPALVNVATAEQ